MAVVESFTLDIQPLTQSPRTIWVCLPDSYKRKRKKKFDVLYMFDGHNLFFDEVATYGKCWGIKEYLERTGLDLVVIGQDCNHEGEGRMNEYCPYPARKTKWLEEPIVPQGDFTAKWFAEVLKPECEKRYRIRSERSHVGIGGSSMGGLMSLYCIAKYNTVYSKAACVSPAAYFCDRQIKDLIRHTDFGETRVYIDLGSKEAGRRNDLVRAADLMLTVSHLYEMKGCVTWPRLIVNGTHSEASWEKAFPDIIEFLYPELFKSSAR